MVDENKVEGAAKTFGGKIQEAVGEMTGDAKTQVQGWINQATGKAQNTFGSAMDEGREWVESIAESTKAKPLTALALAVSVGYLLRMMTHWSRR